MYCHMSFQAGRKFAEFTADITSPKESVFRSHLSLSLSLSIYIYIYINTNEQDSNKARKLYKPVSNKEINGSWMFKKIY